MSLDELMVTFMAHDQRSMKNQEQEEEALQSQLNDKIDEVAMYAEAFQRN